MDATPDPVSCDGYPEPRVFIEAQAWWKDPDEAFPGRHTHIGTCFPVDGSVVSGTIGFDIRLRYHAQPVGATATRVRISNDSKSLWSQTTGLPDVSGQQDVDAWLHADIDTSTLSQGRHEMRFAAYVLQPDGNTQLVTSGWQLCVRSCSPRLVRTTAEFWTEARGWYDVVEYENARFLSPLPAAPLAGIWSPTVQCAAPSGVAPQLCAAYLDPDFHHGNAGTELFSVAGPATRTLNIDTSALSLAAQAGDKDGRHDRRPGRYRFGRHVDHLQGRRPAADARTHADADPDADTDA